VAAAARLGRRGLILAPEAPLITRVTLSTRYRKLSTRQRNENRLKTDFYSLVRVESMTASGLKPRLHHQPHKGGAGPGAFGREPGGQRLIATLLLSQGVPMLLAGDELGHTQHGNNNAYCQDNEVSWLQWPFSELQPGYLAISDSDGPVSILADFTRQLIRLRADHPVFRRRRFFTGPSGKGTAAHQGDIAWFRPDSSPMEDADWEADFAKSLTVFLNGDAITDESFLLMFNAAEHDVEFIIPPAEYGERWVTEARDTVPLMHRSLQLLRRE
jgi:pullulanase/glycogen debranching enzyme